MAYRKIPDDEKAMWLLQMEVLGYPDNENGPYQITKQKNAPSAITLRRWWKIKDSPSIDNLVKHKKRDFVEELKELLGLHIDAAKEAVKGHEDIRAIDTGIGIIVDKLQLLQGEPTDIKKVNVTDDRARIMARITENAGVFLADAIPGMVPETNGRRHPTG